MAKIVFGVATSHSPQLSTPVEQWNLHVDRDHVNQKLHYRGGVYQYDELYRIRQIENLDAECGEEKWMQKYDQWEDRMEQVREQLLRAAPDVLVVVGDDQRELFLDDGMPTFSVFWGDQVHCIPAKLPHASLEPARWANYGEREEYYPTDGALGRHIVEQMMVSGFDVAQLTRQAEGRGIGHSFIFTKHRLMMDDLDVPMVPITINTYFPPNQPTCTRCFQFGRTLKQAIDRYPADIRVAVVASGGLSHFVVDEALDRQALQAMLEKDEAALMRLPEEHMTSGTSEVKNWIAAAGAMEHLTMELVDYIPAYRTPAGTGCGMGFAVWK